MLHVSHSELGGYSFQLFMKVVLNSYCMYIIRQQTVAVKNLSKFGESLSIWQSFDCKILRSSCERTCVYWVRDCWPMSNLFNIIHYSSIYLTRKTILQSSYQSVLKHLWYLCFLSGNRDQDWKKYANKLGIK